MILFQEDWQLYPTAIADYKTTNADFVRYSELLDKMNIKNNQFALSLMQPELSGLDIYSPDFPHELRPKVAIECEYNPWYFLREVMRIPPIAGLDPVPFIANRGNISMFWSYLNHIDYMLIQIRQTGKSVSTDSLSSWLMYYAMRNSRMLLITKDDTLRRENVIRLRKMRGYFPKWLIFDDPNDANNQSTLTYNTRGNIYRTAVGQNSEDAALNVGRGASVATLHNDEGPFTSYIDITLPAALAAGNAARDQAAANGLPYGNIFTTTAGKTDSRSGAFMYKYYTGACPWSEKFFDLKNNDELRDVVSKTGKGRKIMIVGEFDHLQLGYTDEWLYRKIIEVGANGEEADRDFFNRWTSGGVGSPIPVEILEAIKKSKIDPLDREITENRYVINWYRKSEEIRSRMSRPILLGLDTSDAIGQDDIALTFTDAYDLSVVGTANLNETNLLMAAKLVAWILVNYKNVTLIIEKKSSAQTFIDTAIIELVKVGQDPFKRVFNRIYNDRVGNAKIIQEIENTPSGRRNVDFYDKYRGYFGFNTTGATRDTLYGSVLLNATKRTSTTIYDKILSDQICGLVVKNGRIDHRSGGHDDNVISWLLTHWLLMYGKNLMQYGIDPQKVVMRVSSNGEVGTQEELDKLEYQSEIRDKIEEKVEKLRTTRNPHLLLLLENEIRVLNNEIENLGGEAISIDALIKEAKQARSRSMAERRRHF